MNIGELRAYFLDVLNRTDCTVSQADTFITMGIRRVERLIRTPLQKASMTVTVEADWPSYVFLPFNYIGSYSATLNGEPINRIAASQIGSMTGYLVEDARLKFYPDLKEGDVFKLVYFNEFTKGDPDGTTTAFSAVLPDLMIYAALVFACDTFVDERKATFETTMASLVDEAQTMADLDEITGGSMAITPQGGGII